MTAGSRRAVGPITTTGEQPGPATGSLSGVLGRFATWRRRRRNLRSSVAWSATLVVGAWLLVLAAVAVLVVGVSLGRAADDQLRAKAQAVSATLVVAGDGSVTQLESPNDQALDTDTWIFDGRGALVEGPTAGSAEPASVSALAQSVLVSRQEALQTSDPDDPTRLLALPVPSSGSSPGSSPDGSATAVVVTATSLLPYQQLRDLTLVGVVVLGVLVLGGVHAVLRASLARALRPVAQMSEQVDRWSTVDPGQRLGGQLRPEELASLAGTLDALLDRIAAALRHEQALTAELSHELRTPLAGMRAELDWARAPERTAAEREGALADVDAALHRAEDVVEGLLASARSATAAPGRCPVSDAVDRVVAARRAAGAPDGGALPVMSSDVDPALAVGVEAAVLERALAPLVDNACRYASSQVVVRAWRTSSLVHVVVVDDGPGVAPDLIERVLEPGFRADPGEAHRGAGLGLALAVRLARTAGGDLVVQPSGRGGGGVVELRLPPA